MSGLFGILLALCSLPLLANSTISSMVHYIDLDPRPGEDALVFLSTGEVGRVPMQDQDKINALLEGRDNKTWFRIVLNDEREIIRFKEIDQPASIASSQNQFFLKQHATFKPTIVKDLNWANTYFQQQKLKTKESQCFNRAHVWSHELYKKHNIYTNKIFLFFTRKYIRETNFGWWFHIAPLMHVAVGQDVKERVLDRKYNKTPATVHTWIKTFMKEGHPCATVTTYSDYANYPESNYCYIMRASMYYYWPLDLEREELYGHQKVGWNEDELRSAYKDALGTEPSL